MNRLREVEKTVVENGLRTLTVPMPHLRSITLLVLVGTGSRYEERRINGISHFMEHMFFKGADRYPDALAVSSAIDSVGGLFNAFTGEEKVGYYVKLSASRKEVAYDVLSDMLLKARFDSEEIEKERGVIVEEIRMYNDDPMSRVHLDFKEHFYGDQPLGWNIAGPEEVIRQVKREDFMDYRNAQYTGDNCVIAAAGGITHEEHLELTRRFFRFSEKRKAITPPPYEKREGERSILRKRDIEQSHFIMGFPIPGDDDPLQPALKVLTNVLGGTMSSRLFQNVREKRGLAYYIRAGRSAYTDTGAFTVSAGINVEKLEEALACVMGELDKVVEEGITGEEFERARENLKGRLDLSLEDSMGMAGLFAFQEVLYGRIKTPEQLIGEIDALGLDEVNEAAKRVIRREAVKLAILGPYDDLQPFDRQLG